MSGRPPAGWHVRAYFTVIPSILVLSALCWIVTVGRVFEMSVWRHPDPAALANDPGPVFFSVAILWLVMMAAMMLPPLVPMLAGYIAFSGKSDYPRPVILPAIAFAGGFLLVWGAFGALAAAGQTALLANGLLRPDTGRLAAPALAAALLIFAGLYQWATLKHRLLDRCRAPTTFFMRNWRDGKRGAVVMGLAQGIDSVFCYGPIMLLLFVLGVVSLPWIVLVMLVILAENTAPRPTLTARVSGIVMVVGGAWVTLNGI